ncbi:MAG: hypothetical protein JWM33_2439 [Caulobacteraceae bacterium]|nr:hypothetical protein [Caulobacteraceae bacterium]
MSPKLAARIFAALALALCAFQLALAAGLPWGDYAMGGAFSGTLPPSLRIAAVVQALLISAAILVILSRAGLALPSWRNASRYLVWPIVALLGASLVLNLITPSGRERLIWAPVAGAMFLTALRVLLAR